MALLKREEIERLMLSNTPSAELFIRAMVIGAILTAVFGVIAAIGYFPEGDIVPFFLSLLVFLSLWTFGGLILRSEYAFISPNDSFTTFRAPLLSTLTFIVIIATSVFLYQSSPAVFWMEPMMEVTFVLPVIVLVVGSFLFTLAFRKMYLAYLFRNTDLDFYELAHANELNRKLHLFWEYTRRYEEPLYLGLISIHAGQSVRFKERQQILEHIYKVLADAVRKADTMGQLNSRTIWLILSRTMPEEAHIPMQRLQYELDRDETYQQLRRQHDLTINYALSGYLDQMDGPDDLISFARETLEEAKEKNELIIRGVPEQRNLLGNSVEASGKNAAE
ncbi:MAG: diguanylate cyclase domain-containing protein [Spirochaetales bacterium]